jgi:hypothetical protein
VLSALSVDPSLAGASGAISLGWLRGRVCGEVAFGRFEIMYDGNAEGDSIGSVVGRGLGWRRVAFLVVSGTDSRSVLVTRRGRFLDLTGTEPPGKSVGLIGDFLEAFDCVCREAEK